jgi:hypothetical protein
MIDECFPPLGCILYMLERDLKPFTVLNAAWLAEETSVEMRKLGMNEVFELLSFPFCKAFARPC